MRQKYEKCLKNEISSPKQEIRLPSLDEIFHNSTPEAAHQNHCNNSTLHNWNSVPNGNNTIAIPSLDAELCSSNTNTNKVPHAENIRSHFNFNSSGSNIVLPRDNVRSHRQNFNEYADGILPPCPGYHDIIHNRNFIPGKIDSTNNNFHEMVRPSKHLYQYPEIATSSSYRTDSNSFIHRSNYERVQQYLGNSSSLSFSQPISSNNTQSFSVSLSSSSAGKALSSEASPYLTSTNCNSMPSPKMSQSHNFPVYQAPSVLKTSEYHSTVARYNDNIQYSPNQSNTEYWKQLPRQDQDYGNHSIQNQTREMSPEANQDYQLNIGNNQKNVSSINSKMNHLKYRTYSQKSMKEGMIYKRKRQNIPKEITKILISWLEQHLSNPYPTNKEKTELLEKTNLTIQQLDTWFVNTRKRKVKEMKKNLKHSDN